MQIKDFFIQGGDIHKPVLSPNHSGKFKPGMPDTIVLHYTAGPAKPSINTLTNPKVKASAHLVVDIDGSVTQLVPFNLISWHAGRSSHGGRTGLNKYSIGIEMVNWGMLTKKGDKFYTWTGHLIDRVDVIKDTHRNQTKPGYWHAYTVEQMRAVEKLCRLFINEYRIKHILGHEEIAPIRKIDPGPAFPLDILREKLLH